MTEWLEIALKIFVALGAGALVGMNRDIHGKPTGVRVHGLVSLGAALFVLCAEPNDPSGGARIIQGIVGGVGFLGAGVILHSGGKFPGSEETGSGIRHLSTAASIWLTAALGAAAALGRWPVALLGTLAAVIVLTFGGKIDHALFGRAQRQAKREAMKPTDPAA